MSFCDNDSTFSWTDIDEPDVNSNLNKLQSISKEANNDDAESWSVLSIPERTLISKDKERGKGLPPKKSTEFDGLENGDDDRLSHHSFSVISASSLVTDFSHVERPIDDENDDTFSFLSYQDVRSLSTLKNSSNNNNNISLGSAVSLCGDSIGKNLFHSASPTFADFKFQQPEKIKRFQRKNNPWINVSGGIQGGNNNSSSTTSGFRKWRKRQERFTKVNILDVILEIPEEKMDKIQKVVEMRDLSSVLSGYLPAPSKNEESIGKLVKLANVVATQGVLKHQNDSSKDLMLADHPFIAERLREKLFGKLLLQPSLSASIVSSSSSLNNHDGYTMLRRQIWLELCYQARLLLTPLDDTMEALQGLFKLHRTATIGELFAVQNMKHFNGLEKSEWVRVVMFGKELRSNLYTEKINAEIESKARSIHLSSRWHLTIPDLTSEARNVRRRSLPERSRSPGCETWNEFDSLERKFEEERKLASIQHALDNRARCSSDVASVTSEESSDMGSVWAIF